MKGLVICVSLVCGALSMTTMAPHHEKAESDSFKFTYDGRTGLLLVESGSKCYIWMITDDERQMVHTDQGLRQIEMRVLTEIQDAYYTVVPSEILNPSLTNACGNHVHSYYLVH